MRNTHILFNSFIFCIQIKLYGDVSSDLRFAYVIYL